MSSYPPHYAYPSAPPVVRAVPDPPRLHWGWVLALSFITFGFFGMIWLIVQSLWVRKVRGRSKTLPWAIVYASTYPVVFLSAFFIGVIGAMHLVDATSTTSGFTLIVRIASIVLWIGTVFTLQGELNADPINIPLNGVMTFFFGPVYFQYHLQDYQMTDAVHQFRGPLRTELPEPAAVTLSES